MSSDINEAEQNSSIANSDTSMTDVVLDNTAVNEEDLEKLQLGINSNSELQQYITAIADNSSDISKWFTILFNTTNTDILNSFGKSFEFGKVLQQALVQAANDWNQDLIKLILKALSHIPFDLQVLLRNALGIAVKDIKNTASEKDNTEIYNIAISLMDKWKELKKNLNVNINGKRENTDKSLTEENESLPAKKTIKLAIQKEPPQPKPKSVVNTNFFSSMISEPSTTTTSTSTKKAITPIAATTNATRPIYSVDRILENISKNDKTNEDIEMSPATPPTTSTTSTKSKKRVQFKDDLVEIREFTSFPGERTRFFSEDGFYGEIPPQASSQLPFMQIDWYPPSELMLDTDNPRLTISKQIFTEESQKQENREKTELAAIYTSIQHIPPSPAEPDEEKLDSTTLDASVPIIPLSEADRAVPITTATANVAINPIMAPHQPADIAPATVLNNTTIPTLSYRNQFQLSNQTTAAQTPANQPSGISSDAIDTWIKNNPGILNTLKQLSFLAQDNYDSTLQQAPTYKLPSAPSAPQMGWNQATGNGNASQPQSFNHNGWNKRNALSSLSPSPPPPSQNGWGQTGSISPPLRKKPRDNRSFHAGRGVRKTVPCVFYNSTGGCRKGVNCPFLHD
ncbi:MAG: hypothetical protein EXX96DRAFT_649690 [Benjaminiella poitrasii]|nr:MAG: hypothetical protein EXX96DRAFT_649690 [Benjaminiella poitrasii]